MRLRPVMGGIARSFGDPGGDPEPPRGERAATLVAEWLELAASSGMPFDPRLWSSSPPASSYPACQAVVAAAEQGPEAADAYLRRAREALMTERRGLDHAEALVAEAAAAGLDVERFRIDLASNAILERLGEQLERSRSPSREAREAGLTHRDERGERLRLPALELPAAAPGEAGWISAEAPYEQLAAVARAAGCEPQGGERPGPVEAVLELGRAATREVEELSGRPAPVARAELWAAAREWRLRAVPVLIGELWEPA